MSDETENKPVEVDAENADEVNIEVTQEGDKPETEVEEREVIREKQASRIADRIETK